MTQIESILICTMIKNKYSGKTVGEVFPDIILPDTKFDDLKCDGFCLSNGTKTFMYPVSQHGLVYISPSGYDYEYEQNLTWLEDHIDIEDKI